MDIIEIRRLRVRTEVGFSDHEIGKPQELCITAKLGTSVATAGKTDNVKDTVNYKSVSKSILFHVEHRKYNLIETVATDVARICVALHNVSWVRVMVEKPNALRFTDCSSVIIERRPEDFEPQTFHVSFGSNIKPLVNIPQALSLLRQKVNVDKVSRMFLTTPIGFKEQEDFVNMAAVIKTRMQPEELKRFLCDVEDHLVRVRDPKNKSGPRTIDLDISFCGDSISEYKHTNGSTSKIYSIPDPDTLTHGHVIIPLADVTPDFVHPHAKKPLRKIAQDVCGQENFESFFSTVKAPEQQRDKILPFPKTEQDSPKKPQETEIGTCPRSKILRDGASDTTGCIFPVALVTGAAKRIGACITRSLHNSGYNVLVHYNTSSTEATNLVEELSSVRSNSAQLIQGDLSQDISMTADRVVKDALKIWGRLDILVNNASQFYPTNIGKVTEKAWNELVGTNLCAPFFLCQAAYPSLKESNGCIVNLLDIHGERPLSDYSVYSISKAGLQMCTLSLAKEFAPYVRVNGVAPGAILWPSSFNNSKDNESFKKQDSTLEKIPFKRRGEPANIADIVLFLAKSAGYITGQIICVDGGRTLNQ